MGSQARSVIETVLKSAFQPLDPEDRRLAWLGLPAGLILLLIARDTFRTGAHFSQSTGITYEGIEAVCFVIYALWSILIAVRGALQSAIDRTRSV